MRRFADRLKSEQGFSLIEMIAAMTLFSLILGIISMVTMFGFRSYHKITIENSLRDEADIIMSTIITELYTFSPEKVENTATGLKLVKGNEERLISLQQEQVPADSTSDTGEGTGGSTENESSSGGKTQIILSDVINQHSTNERITGIISDLNGSSVSSSLLDGRSCVISSPCQSGLIDIQLVLTQYYDGRAYELNLNSKFGF